MASKPRTNYDKAVNYSLSNHALTLITLINTVALVLWIFDFYKPALELVYPASPTGMWIAIGVQLVLTFAIKHTYEASHRYHALAELEELAEEVEAAKAKKSS